MPPINAIIPAAGLSRRMGQPKLMMTIGGETIIRRLITQLAHPEIASVHVLVRSDDDALVDEIREAGGEVLIADTPPPDMRASVQILVTELSQRFESDEKPGWLLVPADHPVVHADVLGNLVAIWNESTASIVIPTYLGKRGHPTIFPNWLPEEIARIPDGNGLNWVVHEHHEQTLEVPCESSSVLWDVDTPEDFARIRDILEE